MKELRKTLLSFLQTQFGSTFKTYLTGFPFYISAELLPALAVYSAGEEIVWSARFSQSKTYKLAIEVLIDASQEIEQRNRGIANEDFLNDRVEEICEFLRTHPTLGLNYTLGPIVIDYQMPEGTIRLAHLLVSFS